MDWRLMGRNAKWWLALVISVALHVLDETLTGFLPFYNEIVIQLRERLGFFPFPTFTFRAWLGGLCVAIALGLLATPLVSKGGTAVRIVTTFLGVAMIANASTHLLGSLYFSRIIPGAMSSPLLLVTSIGFVREGVIGDWRRRAVSSIRSC
jgi:hypothetical protein